LPFFIVGAVPFFGNGKALRFFRELGAQVVCVILSCDFKSAKKGLFRAWFDVAPLLLIAKHRGELKVSTRMEKS